MGSKFAQNEFAQNEFAQYEFSQNEFAQNAGLIAQNWFWYSVQNNDNDKWQWQMITDYDSDNDKINWQRVSRMSPQQIDKRVPKGVQMRLMPKLYCTYYSKDFC